MTVRQDDGFDPRPREESDRRHAVAPCVTMFRSAPSRRERRNARRKCDPHDVSIRALAKRATVDRSRSTHRRSVSIRALAKRATGLKCGRHSRASMRFDPRPREESDSFVDNAIVGQGKEERRREPLPRTPAPPPVCERGSKISLRYQTAKGGANPPGKSGTLAVRATGLRATASQTISGPPRSTAAFAPTCSTRRRQFAPR